MQKKLKKKKSRAISDTLSCKQEDRWTNGQQTNEPVSWSTFTSESIQQTSSSA